MSHVRSIAVANPSGGGGGGGGGICMGWGGNGGGGFMGGDRVTINISENGSSLHV